MTTQQTTEGPKPSRARVVYWNHDMLGEGTVIELGRDSVRLVGNYVAVSQTVLQLMLRLPDDPRPLSIPRAVVRRVEGLELDVEFLTVPNEDQDRLNAFWAHAQTPRSATAEPVAGDSRGRRSPAHVLVIDDEDSVRTVVRHMLEQVGLEVTEASDGRQGLAAYRARPVDLVITDLFMPEMHGNDLIMELTDTFGNVKVIAMSGRPDRAHGLGVSKLLGVRRILQKPFSRDALLSMVNDELAH